MHVVWEGAQWVNHSLALVNREITHRLLGRRDATVQLIRTEPDSYVYDLTRYQYSAMGFSRTAAAPDVVVRHHWPPNLTPPAHGRWIFFQPWEFGPVPRAWVPAIRHAEAVWVYSDYTKAGYVASGVPEDKIQVVRLGVDPRVFTPQGPTLNLPTQKAFRFLFVGGTIYRKGIDTLLRAYLSTFSRADDVVLIIKDMGTRSFYKGQTYEQFIQEARTNPAAPEIVYLDQDLSPPEMAALYRTAACLVHPYRGEGFGLPILEAMACGVPVMIPDRGPAAEYCSDQMATRIPSRIVPVKKNPELAGTPYFIEVDAADLGAAMREAVLSFRGLAAKAKRAQEMVHQTMTWPRVAQTVMRFLGWSGEPIEPPLPPAGAFLAEVSDLVRMRRFGPALKKTAEGLAADPANGDLINYQAIIHVLLNQYADALPLLERYAAGRAHPAARAMHEMVAEAVRRTGPGRPPKRDVPTVLAAVAHSFEGEETVLRARRQQWLPYFRAGQRVLDVGCGNGYFMDMLRGAGVVPVGIETDISKVEDARLRGLQVFHGTLEAYAASRDPGEPGFDGIFMGHIIEHMDPAAAVDLLLTARSLATAGGKVLLLTPNIHHPTVMGNFWLDASHVRPYPMALMIRMVEEAGFTVKESAFLEDGAEYYVLGEVESLPLRWVAPVTDASGYASESRDFLKSLRPFPYNVHVQNAAPDDKAVVDLDRTHLDALMHKPPQPAPIVEVRCLPGWALGTPGTPVAIGRTMFETDRIPADWVDNCNAFTEIWVPSTFNRETFARSGVMADKLYVMPGPLDAAMFRPDLTPLDIWTGQPDLRGFVFLSVFDWNYRKGWDVLLEAYVREFGPADDVSLLLKVPAAGVDEMRRHVDKLARGRAGLPHIAVFTQALAASDFPRLYAAADAYVLPTRGEGWGRTQMEALACGLPVITTRWGGHLDFLSDDNSWLVDIEGLEPVDERMAIDFYRGHLWARPSVDHLRAQMRRVAESPGEARARARTGSEAVRARYALEVIGERVHDRLTELLCARGLGRGTWGEIRRRL